MKTWLPRIYFLIGFLVIAIYPARVTASYNIDVIAFIVITEDGKTVCSLRDISRMNHFAVSAYTCDTAADNYHCALEIVENDIFLYCNNKQGRLATIFGTIYPLSQLWLRSSEGTNIDIAGWYYVQWNAANQKTAIEDEELIRRSFFGHK